ncbi:GNAT family N-acetyltransferase [Ornithinibacillus bavariensis]|uniref:GNAT family acetyltransferase n=1 Tax=Ornithinibacillus bavariensis TaxID=545502 RepID=A0A919XA26_9BACI|nr:GNAT family N-acetyltransferase [Ornithinibacillus bavariensis]GIO27157.1 GNAT family acetyltransferase [Ornithinibacillus bavariensis]
MHWQLKSFNELTVQELYGILKARTDIFVVEQECPYPELDNYDQKSLHYYLTVEGEIAAYVRLLPKGLVYKETPAIGRVLVVEKFRSRGYAREIMENALHIIDEKWQESSVRIQAQAYLKGFYESLGFQQISSEYLEDGIPHIDMLLEGN